MKTILITISEDIVSRNILQSDFWSSFRSNNQGVRIVLLVQPDRLGYYTEMFAADPNVVLDSFKRARPKRLENLVMSLARSGINTHTNLWSKMRSYYRGDSSLVATALKIIHQYTLANFNGYKRFLRKIILLVGRDDGVQKLFAKHQPDLLCAFSLTNYDFDVVIAREAKRRNVRIFGMVRSWDNLSSHGLLRVVPDVLVLQNQFLKNMAIKYQAINEKDVLLPVVGLPHYDATLDPSTWLIERSEFLSMLKVNPANRIITYGAMGSFLFVCEDELPQIFDQMIGEGMLGENITLVYRGHPKFQIESEKLQRLRHVIYDDNGAYLGGNQFKLNPTNFLFNLLYHSDVVITGGSTVAIDAAVLDKPIVCVGFDGKNESGRVNRWESVRRFYDLYTHFEELVHTGGVRVAYTQSELARFVKGYLADPNLDRHGRQKIVDLFVDPLDGKSGERLANLLDGEIEHLP